MKVYFILDSDKDPVAVFPDELYNEALCDKEMVVCYCHVGQHSGCAIGWAWDSLKATQEQYAALYDELVRIGYDDLEIINTLKED